MLSTDAAGKAYKIMVLGEEKKKTIQSKTEVLCSPSVTPKTRNSLNLTFVSGAFGVLLHPSRWEGTSSTYYHSHLHPLGAISPRLAPRLTRLERGWLTRAATVPGHTCALLLATFLFHGSATHPFQNRLPLKRTALATGVRKCEIKVGVLGKASWHNRNFWLPFSHNSFQKHSWCMAKCWCRQCHLKWEGWYLKKNPLSCWH